MSVELYRTNTPPLRGDIVEHNGRQYRITKTKRVDTEPWPTCIVYGVGHRLSDQQADLHDAVCALGRAFDEALGLTRLTRWLNDKLTR